MDPRRRVGVPGCLLTVAVVVVVSARGDRPKDWARGGCTVDAARGCEPSRASLLVTIVVLVVLPLVRPVLLVGVVDRRVRGGVVVVVVVVVGRVTTNGLGLWWLLLVVLLSNGTRRTGMRVLVVVVLGLWSTTRAVAAGGVLLRGRLRRDGGGVWLLRTDDLSV